MTLWFEVIKDMVSSHNIGFTGAVPELVSINNRNLALIERAATEGTSETFAEAMSASFVSPPRLLERGHDLTHSVRMILAAVIATRSVEPRSSRPCP